LGIKAAGQIIVWEWKSQSYILSQKGLVHDTLSLASYKNSKYIATGTTQGEVKLW
jgi:periodic tryptophan protein 2